MSAGRIPDRVWSANDITRLNGRARQLLLEGKSPGEVSGIVGSDVFVLAQLILLAREDFHNGDRWRQLMNKYRVECGMRPRIEKHPLAWLLSAGVQVMRDGGEVYMDPPDGYDAAQWEKCIEYARQHKAEILEALPENDAA